jgi:hypothetical protein
MTFERSMAGIPAEPAPPAASAALGPAQTGEVSPALRAQILATEHSSLLATRSMAWNEIFSRSGMYLSALSGAIVALALVGQGSGFSQPFYLFGIVILPVVLFIGLTTFIRLAASNLNDATCVIGMNRIRAGYLEIAPELERYFVMSSHDDVRGVGVTMGATDGAVPILHILASTPTVIATVNSVVLAAVVALITLQLGLATPVLVILGVAAFVASEAFYAQYGRQQVFRVRARVKPLFPSPEA